MKIILDQGLPRSTILHLAGRGIDAVHVGDLGMATATDDEILAYGREQSAAVVTLDSDFHRNLAASGESGPSVVRIRIEGLGGGELAKLIVRVIATAGTELEKGAIASVTKDRIRVRSLPIGR